MSKLTPKSRPREIAKRVKSRFNLDVTPEFVTQVLAVIAVYRDMKAEADGRLHESIMGDIHGHHGQG